MVFGSNSCYVPKLRLIPFRASLIFLNILFDLSYIEECDSN